jgi:hypothetical protein
VSFQGTFLLSLLTIAQALFLVQASEPVSKVYFVYIAIDGDDVVGYHNITESSQLGAIKAIQFGHKLLANRF